MPSNDKEVSKFETLCTLHPDDPSLYKELAHLHKGMGNTVSMVAAAQKAYQILHKENKSETEQLRRIFGREIAASDMKPEVSECYLPLASYFGKINTFRKKVHLADSHVLFHEGEKADCVYLVLEGELTVSYMSHGTPTLINLLHKGAIVGEGALNPEMIRVATVAANTDTVLLKFSPQEVLQAFSNHPDLHLTFNKEAIARRNVNILANNALFSKIPNHLKFLLAKHMWSTQFEINEPISTTYGESIYLAIVAKGCVQASDQLNNTAIPCGRVTQNQVFGLQPFIDNRSNLSYTASETTEVIYLDKTIIDDLMEVSTWFRHMFRDTLADFSVQLQNTLALYE